MNSELLLFCQTDHAHLSGELLALWRDPRLVEHPRREDLLFAVRRHDNGWQEADAAPILHPAGDRPHDFLSIPASLRREIWERGSTRFASERPYAALLITEHALHLLHLVHRSSRTEGSANHPDADFLLRLAERRASLLEIVGLEEEELKRDYAWLRLADFLSLVVCNGWSERFARGVTSGQLAGEHVLRLEPFPYAGPTTFRVACRRLERRHFAGDAELAGALAESRWEEWTVSVQRSASPGGDGASAR